MAVTIYHNPRCSKSRKTLELINDAGAEHSVVLYLKNPPDAGMKLNPHGTRDATREGAGRLADLVSAESFARVCGYNYTVDFAGWRDAFLRLI